MRRGKSRDVSADPRGGSRRLFPPEEPSSETLSGKISTSGKWDIGDLLQKQEVNGVSHLSDGESFWAKEVGNKGS